MSGLEVHMPPVRAGLKAVHVLLFLVLVAAGCGGGSSGPGNASPEAAFTVSTGSGFAPLSVTFSASGSTDSDGTISSYAWGFGDGTTASGQDVQHTYQTAGTYNAVLTVTDNGGLTDTQSRQITVSASPPEADFTVSTDSGIAPLQVTFDASGSTDADGTITNYAWAFGDGETGSGQSTQHTYQTSGSYMAELTITDNDGLTDTQSQGITVEAFTAPEAQFTVSTDIGSFPLFVEFDASGSSGIDGTIVSYAWTFGDGETGSGQAVQHSYETPGNYTAELTVTDSNSLTNTQLHEIEVKPRYTLNGTVTSAEHMVADSDVNDVLTIPESNNTFAHAQVITAPVTVSGYVNVAGSGPEGLSEVSGDTDDYYGVSLVQGMNITLYMVENSNFYELNLDLYNNQRALIDSTFADGGNGIASLTVPQDGNYYLRVWVDDFTRTATVYALTIGFTGGAVAQYPLRLSDDFVPGEVLVRFEEEEPSVSATALKRGAATVSVMGFSTKAGGTGRDRLLTRSSVVDKDIFFERLGVKDALERSVGPGNMDAGTRAKMETLWMVRAMRRQPGILFAEPNYIRRPLLVPNDTHYHYQWHYPLINLPEAWDITTGSSDVVVAVVDTGVLLGHPDLKGQLVSGYDFISDDTVSLDEEPGIDDNPDDPGDQDSVEGSSFHGTHVAGTIAAASDNGKGVAGIAWNAKIMPLRALGKGGGTTYDIMEAVKYASGLPNDSGTTLNEPVDIINLSLGSEGSSIYERYILTQARQQGVIIIASAGNEGSDTPMYPAAYDDVVSVSAVTINETLASYSNYGSTIDVAAPGGSSTDTNGDGYPDGVLSTMGDDSSESGTIEMIYAFSTGTSMAAPHVSGIVALMRSLYPEMTPDEFDTLLAGGYLTRDIGDEGRDDKFGYGLIDAYKAVVIASTRGVNGGLPPLLTTSPTILNFGTWTESLSVTVKNGGGDEEELFVTGYSSDSSWLSVTASGDVDLLTGLGSYTVEVDRGGLGDGKTYTGTITFDSNKNQAEVSVVVQKVSEDATTDGGYHYVLLLDPDTFDTIDQVESAGENGVYEYSFPGLPYHGNYVIFAGTDPNNDYLICDDGEACGAYISLDKPVELKVTSDMTGLDFTTDINITLPEVQTSRFAGTELPFQRIVLKEIAK